MVTKIKKSIANSKRKGDFKKRQQGRIEKKHRQENAERNEFVDKKDILQKKREKKALKKEKKQ